MRCFRRRSQHTICRAARLSNTRKIIPNKTFKKIYEAYDMEPGITQTERRKIFLMASDKAPIYTA
jgi:hypothetical protein